MAGTVGKIMDLLLDPLSWIVPDFITGVEVNGVKMINKLSFDPEIRKKVTEGSLDPYTATKNAFLQYRENLLNK